MLATLRRLVHAADLAFCRLERIRFAAPWRPAAPCGAGGR